MKAKGKILVVDDSYSTGEFIKIVLEEDGYLVQTEQSGETALFNMNEIKPDLILLDLWMPGMNGFEVCKILKADVQTKEIPIIFLSATTDTAEKIKGFQFGAVDYITKPFDQRELLARVQTQIQLSIFKKENVIQSMQLRQYNQQLEQEIAERENMELLLQQQKQEILSQNEEFQQLNEELEQTNRELISAKIATEESEIRFRALHNASFGGITIHDKGLILDCNQGLSEITGYTYDQLVGMDGLLLIAEKSWDEVRTNIASGFEKPYDVYGIKKNGEEYPLRLQARNIPYRGKQVRVVEFRDITEEIQANENLAKFKMGIDSSANAIFITDLDGTIEYVNNAFEKIYGYTRSEAIGKTPRILKSGLLSDEDYEHFWNTLLAKKPVVGELKNKAKNGHIITIEATNTPIINENDEIIGFISINRDITEKKQVELALKESENRLDLFFSQSLDGFFFMMFDEPIDWNDKADKDQLLEYTFDHLKITQINDAMLEQYGASHEQFLRLPLKEFFKHNIEQGKNVIRELFDSSRLHAETEERKLNGEQIIIEGDYTIIYDPEQRIIGLFGIQRDITERKKAEEQIVKLSTALEQSPSSIIITNTKGEIEYSNPKLTQITGYSPEELKGKNPRIFKSGEKTADDYKELWDTISSGKEWHGEFHDRKKNGELYWESASISPIRNETGKIINYIAIKEDITNQKKLLNELILSKEKAEESDRLKSAFLANMSHEIRTPLNGILGFTELLVDPDFDPEQKNEMAKIILDNGDLLLTIVNDVLDISKIEAGQIVLHPTIFKVERLITEIKNSFIIKAQKLGLELRIANNVGALNIELNTDFIRLKQVLTNLISNALKYTDDGFVEIGCTYKETEVVFYVKDTGIGISEDKQVRIFERFNRDDAFTKKVGGNGLGLAIAKSFVEMLGGRIWVESKVCMGSQFYFTIPYEANNKEIPKRSAKDLNK
jgi:PAS domain S-box-containing protein